MRLLLWCGMIVFFTTLFILGCAGTSPNPTPVFVTKVTLTDGRTFIHRNTTFQAVNDWLYITELSQWERVAAYSIRSVKYVERTHE